jgi:hypothetical protein
MASLVSAIFFLVIVKRNPRIFTSRVRRSGIPSFRGFVYLPQSISAVVRWKSATNSPYWIRSTKKEQKSVPDLTMASLLANAIRRLHDLDSATYEKKNGDLTKLDSLTLGGKEPGGTYALAS